MNGNPRIQWLDPEPVEVPTVLSDAVGGHFLVAEALARRGVLTSKQARAFLDPNAYTPASPRELPDLSLAVERLRQAVARGERIAIWGDLDADGQTATALLFQSLRTHGADVVFHIPTREEGHGLHIAGIDDLLADGARLFLTCDTGVNAHAAASHVVARGADIIITDHHVPTETLPDATAVVNPHRLPPGHAMSTLTGVGVAYELASELDAGSADACLDLVALGTVADVGTLTGDARYQVQRGLEALRRADRFGLKAVYDQVKLRPEGITEEHIGFVLGPRLNAWGRLGDAAQGVELLTTGDWSRARSLATEMESLHARRQWLTNQVTQAALATIDRHPALLNDYHALVLSHASWPSGVIGIVAGRLAERFRKPTVLIATPTGGFSRGSGRSVPGVNLIRALTGVAHLLEGYGGHAGAAGFRIASEQVIEFRAALSRAVAAQVGTISKPTLTVDAYVELSELTLELVADLGRLAPFGPGNPPLTLAVPDLRLIAQSVIGRSAQHRRMTVEDRHGHTRTAFLWHGADQRLPEGRFDLALNIGARDYRGMPEVQIEWLDARDCEPAEIEVQHQPAFTVGDFRAVQNPVAELLGLGQEADTQIWAEGQRPANVHTRTRLQLAEGRRLVIWTLPPGPRELAEALRRVGPDEVMIFAHSPDPDDAQSYLDQLAGLIKFAITERQGEFDLEAAAAKTAQRTSTVRAALSCLAAGGTIAIVERRKRLWRLAPGTIRSERRAAADAIAHLNALLAETAAYRSFAGGAPAYVLLQGMS